MVQDGNAVYDYDPAGQKRERLLDWGDNDIIGSGVAYYGPVGEDGVFAVTRGVSGMKMGLSLRSSHIGCRFIICRIDR